MNKKLSLLAAFPLIAAGTLVAITPAQAGLITPPPPEGNFAFSPFVINGGDAGVTTFIRPNAAPPPIPTVGACVTAECAYFDFLPPAGGTLGNFEVDNASPDPGPFSSPLLTTGTIKDLRLSFLGVTNLPNINVPLPIDSFIDLNPGVGGDVDTFDVTALTGNIFQPLGTGSVASFNFAGFWNVETSPGVIERFAGTVSIANSLVESTTQVINAARTPGGFTASYSGQGNIFSPPPVNVPEPGTLAGLAIVAGSAAMMRKRQKRQ